VYIKTHSKSKKILIFFLNSISIGFKTASFFYLKIKSLNKKQYRAAFIISVDNLSFGGTGKTSLVIKICEELKKRKIKFAIITRGYLSKFEKKSVLINSNQSPKEIGDEAKVLKNTFPNQDIFIGRKRKDSIEKAIENKNRIIILDDGFQSTNIYKDCSIMLLNLEHPYYYLRNFKFLMRKENFILLYSTSQNHLKNIKNVKKKYKNSKYGTYKFEHENFYNKKGKIINIKDSPLIGFSALGDNSRFKESLSTFNLIGFRGYKDHFSYTQNIIDDLNTLRTDKKADYLVCTEKDFVKLINLNLNNIPLIYSKNIIEFNFNLLGSILDYAKSKGFI
jgi:tetraacyldisaccharide 4'-kinase